jgi:hypothetical protein
MKRLFVNADSMQALLEDAIAVFAKMQGRSLEHDLSLACLVLYNMLYAKLMQPVISATELVEVELIIKRYLFTLSLVFRL